MTLKAQPGTRSTGGSKQKQEVRGKRSLDEPGPGRTMVPKAEPELWGWGRGLEGLGWSEKV